MSWQDAPPVVDLFYSLAMSKTEIEKVLVIEGSSRVESNTLKVVRELLPFSDYKLIHLNLMQIGYYSYNHRIGVEQNDDFLSIATEMVKKDIIVFATPVYWYSMSGQMKVFFDRLTELLYEYKSLGRMLKGKRVYLIACGGGATLPSGFEVPFKLTSQYLKMEYVGSFYKQLN